MHAWLLIRSASVCVVLLAALCLLPISARGDGLIQSLPEDGSWVRFEVVQENYDVKSGQVNQTVDGTLTVSSVGKSVFDGQACRFIELKYVFKVGEREQVDRCKLLVAEDRFAAGINPLDNVLRAWVKEPSKPAEIPLDRRMNRDMEQHLLMFCPRLRDLFHGALEDTRRLGDRPLVGKAGRFDCTGVAGKRYLPFAMRGGGFKDPKEGGEFLTFETWHSNEAPFGVVRHRCEWEVRDADKRLMFRHVQKLDLAAIGKDAKSEIPEFPTP